MPLYEYQCDACGHRFERIQKFSDPPADVCPKCGSAIRKLISAPAFQLKGTGWYATDYPKKGAGSKQEDGSKESAPANASKPAEKGSSEEKGAASKKSDTATKTGASGSSSSDSSSSTPSPAPTKT